MLEKEQIGVSTSTFIRLSDPISDGIKTIGARLGNGIYAPEIDQALEAARENGRWEKRWKYWRDQLFLPGVIVLREYLQQDQNNWTYRTNWRDGIR